MIISKHILNNPIGFSASSKISEKPIQILNMKAKPLIYFAIIILIGSMISCSVGYHKEGSGFEDFRNDANIAVAVAHRNELDKANREIRVSQIVDPAGGSLGTATAYLMMGKSNVATSALGELRSMGWQPCKANQYSECYNFRVQGSFTDKLYAECFVANQNGNAP